MSEVLKQLQLDHKNMDRLLTKLATLVERGAPADHRVTIEVLRYMTHYPDVVHHPTEDIMFEHLLRRDAALQPVIDNLTAEHEALVTTGQFLLEIASNARKVAGAAETLREGCQDYIVSLRNHMSIEEGEVFPLARALLSDRDWSTITKKKQPFADPLFGGTILEGYRHLYESLTK